MKIVSNVSDDDYNLACELHYNYEESAKLEGWNTQKECKVRFEDLPKNNKRVMFRMAQFINKNFIRK